MYLIACTISDRIHAAISAAGFHTVLYMLPWQVTSALTLNVVSSLKFVLVIVIPSLIEQEFVPYNWVVSQQ